GRRRRGVRGGRGPRRSGRCARRSPCARGGARRHRRGRAPLFFGRRGLGLQGGLHGPAGEFAGGGDGQGLDAGQDLAVRGVVGGLLQLLGEQQRLLDQQRLQGGLGSKRARVHGGSL